MSESIQKKKLRVRPPRVNLVYEVETNGAIRMKELPFVLGVIADLAGQSKKEHKKLDKRSFADVDRDNLDIFVKQVTPRFADKVDNLLKKDGSQLAVDLEFEQLADFGPDAIVRKVKPLRDLAEVRRQLTDLLSRTEGNDRLEELLTAILDNKEVRDKLKNATGATPRGQGSEEDSAS